MDLATYLSKEVVTFNAVRRIVCGEVGARGVHAR